MAVYGTYYSAYQNGQRMRVVVSYTQNVDTNQSTVTVQYTQEHSSGFIADGAWAVGLSIDGVQVYSWSQYRDIRETLTLATASRTVTHGADGTRTVRIGATSNTGPTDYFRQSVFRDIVLPTIPRAGKPSWSGNFEAGVAKAISIPKASSAYTQDVAVFMGGYALQLATKTAATSVSWTPPMSILEEIPDAASGPGLLRVITYSGAAAVGKVELPFTLVAPASVQPVVSAVVWDDLNTTVKSVVGAFVQGLSLVKGTVTAAGIYGSTITEKKLVLAGSPVPENTPIQVGITGTVAASGEVTDTRGRVGTKTANFSVLPYEPPKLGTNGWQVRRANSSNVADDNGAYLRIDLHAAAKSLVVGTEKNALTVTVRTRPLSGGAWTSRNVVNPGLIHNGAIQVSGGAAFLVNTSWEVEITLSDRTGSTPTVLKTGIGTAKVAFHLGPNGVGVGKMHERGALDVNGAVSSSTSVGVYSSSTVESTLTGSDLQLKGAGKTVSFGRDGITNPSGSFDLASAGGATVNGFYPDGTLRGTTAQMNALAAYEGLRFFHTGENQEYTHLGGRWRPTVWSGEVSVGSGSLAQSGSSGVYVKTITVAGIPVNLVAGEALRVAATGVGTGYGSVSQAFGAIGPNPGPVSTNIRFTQVGSNAAQTLSLIWEVVKV